MPIDLAALANAQHAATLLQRRTDAAKSKLGLVGPQPDEQIMAPQPAPARRRPGYVELAEDAAPAQPQQAATTPSPWDRYSVTRTNPMRAPVVGHAGRTVARMGEDVGAQEQIQGTEYSEATWQADALARESGRLEQEHRRMYGYDVVENEVDEAGAPVFDQAGNVRKRVVQHVPGLIDRQRMEEERVMKDRARAVADLDEMTRIANRTPEPERGTWWANATAGQRAAGVIASIFAGLGESERAVDSITKIVDDEYKAREDRWLMRQRKVDLSRQRVDDHDRLYEVVRSRWDDEQTRRLIWEQHTQSRFLAEFQAKMAAYGVTKLAPQQQQALNAILQKQDDTALALQQRIASTPAKITRSGYVHPKEARELAMARAKAGIDVEKQAAIDATKAALEGGKKDVPLRGEYGVYGEAQKFAKEGGGASLAVLESIANFRKKWQGKGLPGIAPGPEVFGVGPLQTLEKLGDYSGSRQVQADLNQIIESIGRARSQGAITEEEEERFLDSIRSGTFLSGEAAVWDNLTAVEQSFEAKVTPLLRTLSPEARALALGGEEALQRQILGLPAPQQSVGPATNYALPTTRSVVREDR